MRIRPATPGRKPWHTDEYVAYLQSPEWAAIRAEALERASHTCEYRLSRDEWCGETDGLQVHHRSYARLGHEEPGDLQVLCPYHHRVTDIGRQWSARNATLKRKYSDWRPNR